MGSNNVIFKIFSGLKAWFASFGDNWFHVYDNRRIVVVIGKEVENLKEILTLNMIEESLAEKIVEDLKGSIKSSATEAKVEGTLNKIVKKDIEEKGEQV